MRRPLFRILAPMAGVLVLVIVFQGFRKPKGVEVQVAKASRGDLVVGILCDGTLEPPLGGEVRAREAATVTALLVREGDRVKTGDPLLTLSNAALLTTAHEARSLALQLEAERGRAGVELEQARREAAQAQKTLDSDERLLKERAIARAVYETSEMAARAAQERLRLAEQRLESLSRRGGRVTLAQSSAAELESRLSGLAVRAPADGVVYNLPRKVGETVAVGQVIAAVGDTAHLGVRARVDQPDLPRISAGQKMVVTFDGLPGRKWSGQVRQVSPGLREVMGREVGEVLGAISDPSAILPPNASVNVEIVVGERGGALVIPRAALLRDGEERHVFTLKSGRAVRQPVTVGLVGVNEVEISKGLELEQVVILPGVAPLKDGERVTVKGSV